MRRLIINADDYGFDRNRTEAILECFRRGVITQTTAMVNMPYFEEAIRKAKEFDVVDRIGLHINLTAGRPLTAKITKSPLFCDKDGRFSGKFHRSRFARMWLPSFERAAVAEEIAAQMEKYKDFGLSLLHIDSHHHSHTDYAIIGTVLKLAGKLGFRSVRLSRNISSASPSIAKRLYKASINRKIFRSPLRHTDYFGNAVDMLSFIGSSEPNASAELMVHPLFNLNGDMNPDMEYESVSGELCDSTEPISDIEKTLEDSKELYSLATYGSM